MGKKERFAFYLTPEKKAILERRYQEDGSRSMTAFVERAVDFYLDYLSANDAGLFLPASIKSYLDGRLGQLEERLSSLAFRQAVEQDMVAGILADAYQFSDEDLRRRRAESVQNVKKTNGRVSLEQRVRGAWEEGDEWARLILKSPYLKCDGGTILSAAICSTLEHGSAWSCSQMTVHPQKAGAVGQEADERFPGGQKTG